MAVLKILGIPETDVDRMAHLVDTSVDGAEGEGRGGPQMIAAARELNDYLVRELQARQAAPHDPDNIISTIVHSLFAHGSSRAQRANFATEDFHFWRLHDDDLCAGIGHALAPGTPCGFRPAPQTSGIAAVSSR